MPSKEQVLVTYELNTDVKIAQCWERLQSNPIEVVRTC